MPTYPKKPTRDSLGLDTDDNPTFAGIGIGDEVLSYYDEGTFTPTVTLVGGAGNTVPEYSTNTGRYTRIGRIVFVDIMLNGDGGDEGAGTGIINVALPLQVSGSYPTGSFNGLCGLGYSDPNEVPLMPYVAASATTVALYYIDSVTSYASYKGSDQSSTSRTIRISFFYEV